MLNILILGGFSKDSPVFHSVYSVCTDFSSSVVSSIHDFSGSEVQIMRKVSAQIEKSDLVIVEQSLPSQTLGLELRETVMFKKPVLVFLNENATLSPFLKDCKKIIRIVRYSSFDELRLFLRKEILAFSM